MSSTLKLCRSPALRFARTEAFAALGEDSFAPFAARRVPGKVVWCNFELARELGFDVPRLNELTREFEEQLPAKLSRRALVAGEENTIDEIVTMYADRYGGDGVTPALGAGRAGFLRDANLYIKGLGFTPLFRHNDKDDFVHSHGAVHFEDCMSEAIFGEARLCLKSPFSFTPGFSPVFGPKEVQNRFNGFSQFTSETVTNGFPTRCPFPPG